MPRKYTYFYTLAVGLILMLFSTIALAADVSLPGIELNLSGQNRGEVATAFKILLMLTVLSLAPAILIAMTSFTRIIVVLAMMRTAFGMQQTPPNTVLISLALFLALFTMMPTLQKMNDQAFQPYLQGKMSTKKAFNKGVGPIRQFMIRQTRESDLALMIEVSKTDKPETVNDIKLVHLIPAFMLSELKTAFEIGFVVFLPFLLIDLVIASILMSMGMLMVPPMMISLPVKILMFVLIDGWNLVTKSLLGSFL